MKRQIGLLLIVAAVSIASCKKTQNDNTAAVALDSAQTSFQRTFPGITSSNNGLMYIVSGAPDNFNNAAIGATGKVTFGTGLPPFNDGTAVQLQITSARQQLITAQDSGYYYELNIWKWSSPNTVVGTGKLGMIASSNDSTSAYGRAYYKLDISAEIEQFGTYIDSL